MAGSDRGGWVIPPFHAADFASRGEGLHKCTNIGCGHDWVVEPKTGILRCPRDKDGNRLCGMKTASAIIDKKEDLSATVTKRSA